MGSGKWGHPESLSKIENPFVGGTPLRRLGRWGEYAGVERYRRGEAPWLQKAASAASCCFVPPVIFCVLAFAFGFG